MMQRWDPFREMESMRERMARMFEDLWGRPEEREMTMVMTPAMDVIERDNDYEIRASLPGVKPEDVDITATGNTLTIRANRKEEREERSENYLLRERRAGTFSRTITLPEQVNIDQVQASLENGVLTVMVPKSEHARPKRIEVKAGGGTQQIPAGGQSQQM